MRRPSERAKELSAGRLEPYKPILTRKKKEGLESKGIALAANETIDTRLVLVRCETHAMGFRAVVCALSADPLHRGIFDSGSTQWERSVA